MSARIAESAKRALLGAIPSGIVTANEDGIRVHADELRVRNSSEGIALEFFYAGKLAFTMHANGTRLMDDDTVTVTGINFSTDLTLESA